MKLAFIPLILSFILLASCYNSKEVEILNKKISSLNSEMNKIKSINPGDNKILVHSVYFDLNDDLSENEIKTFAKNLNELKKIEYIRHLHLGQPVGTGDVRANVNCDFVMEVYFNSVNDLVRYQQDSIHLASKENSKSVLAGPPVVYDYWSQ